MHGSAVSGKGSSLPPAAIKLLSAWSRWVLGGDGRRPSAPRLLVKQFVFLLPINWWKPWQGLLPSLLGQAGLREARPNAQSSFSLGINELFMPLFLGA